MAKKKKKKNKKKNKKNKIKVKRKDNLYNAIHSFNCGMHTCDLFSRSY